VEGKLQYVGLGIGAKIEPCYCSCRYCLAGPKRYVKYDLKRLEAIVTRFIDWREQKDMKDFHLHCSPFYSLDFSMKRFKRYQALAKRIGYFFPGHLQLNGIQIRSEDEMYEWLLERKEAGVTQIHTAFYGNRELQDKTHGRKGDFDFMVMANRVAADIGLKRMERLFLTKSTLPHLDKLIDRLDGIPGLEARWVQQVGYYGNARRMENERCTRAEIETLPVRVLKCLNYPNPGLMTEAEFMEQVRNGYRLSDVKTLGLWVEDSNIEEIESKTCDEIVDNLKQKWNRLYSLLPDLIHLCNSYGDPFNMRIAGPGRFVPVWRERWLKDHPGLVPREDEMDFVYLQVA
jgi:sulfatase maturation enzyme AslB (radical SAM superfamily)